MNPNRELHELFGHCWHELIENHPHGGSYHCWKCGLVDPPCKPDYAAEPWLVIREMEKRGKLDDFLQWLCDFHFHTRYPLDPFAELVAIDTTGKLRDLAREWMKEQKKGEGDAT